MVSAPISWGLMLRQRLTFLRFQSPTVVAVEWSRILCRCRRIGVQGGTAFLYGTGGLRGGGGD